LPRVYIKRPARGDGHGGQWWLDYYDRGKRIRKPALGPDGRSLRNRAAAERALQRALAEALSHEHKPRHDDALTLAGWLDTHERDHVAQLAEARTRTKRLAYWREHFGVRIRLRDVARADVERYMAGRLKAGKAPATVQRELAALGKALQSAVERGLLDSNPVRGVRVPKHDNRRTRYLDADEERRLLTEAERSRQGGLVAVMLLALDAGGRLGECLRVQPSDVDTTAGLVTFRLTKARRIRHVPLTLRLRDALARRFRETGAGLDVRDIRSAFDAARDRAKLGRDVVFHTLRHTFATNLARDGVTLPTLQQLLGHQSITMTMRYAHVADEAKRAAIAILDRAPSWHPTPEPPPVKGRRNPRK
jgi:site-specific recombinase XerD